MSVRLFLVIAFCGLALACTPETLEGFEENNESSPENNGTNGTNGMVDNGVYTAEFTNVSNILAAKCGQAACHGSSATNAFALVNDQQSTPSEMKQALAGIRANQSSMLLVAGGNLAQSDIWERMSRMSTDTGYMPTGGTMTPQEMTDIEMWITGGAVYQE